MKVSGTGIARAAELRVFPVVIFASWATWSFASLTTLAVRVTGYPWPMAALLPLSLDCLAAMAWLRYERTRSDEALWVAFTVTGTAMTGGALAAALSAGVLEVTWPLVAAVGAVPFAAGAVALHLLAHKDRETNVWTPDPASVPDSATGGREPAPTTAPPGVPSNSPPPSPIPAPPVSLPAASGTAASAGNGGPSDASGSAAAAPSPTTNTAPGAAAPSETRVWSNADLAKLVREQGWTSLSTKEIGSRLRGEGIPIGQRRVGPVKRAALNGH